MNDGEPNWLYIVIGLIVLGFWVRWLLVTIDIREELRVRRAEEKERHKEIVDLLKKEKTPE